MIREQFIQILMDYNEIKKEPLKGNTFTKVLSSKLPLDLKNAANISDIYNVKGSAASGGFAEIPWVAIMDKRVTNSPQNGYYVVYLFDSTSKKLHLSLNQGWAQYRGAYGIKEGRMKIRSTADKLKSSLRSVQGFSYDSLDLTAIGIRAVGYKQGHICGVSYSVETMPDDSILMDDLRNMLGAYRELKGLIGKNILNITGGLGQILEDSQRLISEKEASDILNEIPKDQRLELLKDKLGEAASRGLSYVGFKGKRIKRNAALAEFIKLKNDYKCKACGFTFQKEDGLYYTEAAHIKRLSQSKLDVENNIIPLCPNHHKMLDLGNIKTRKIVLKDCGIKTE